METETAVEFKYAPQCEDAGESLRDKWWQDEKQKEAA